MVYIAQQSFGFGEIDPNIRAQYESQPYQRGCQTLSNALLSSTGSAAKRWGSVEDSSYQTATENSYQYVTGFGDRIMIYGGTTTYSICSANHPVETFTGKIIDAAYRGPDLILLTDMGCFRHEFTKSGTDYSSIRYRTEFNSNLITSVPPVTFSVSGDGILAAEVTTGSKWFTPDDDGDIYRMTCTSTVDGVTYPGVQNTFGQGFWFRLEDDGYVSSTEYDFRSISPWFEFKDFDAAYQDWTGPYRDYLPVGKAITNVDAPGSPLAGVTYGAVDELNFPEALTLANAVTLIGDDTTTPVGISLSFDSDHVSALHAGMFGKLVQTFDQATGREDVVRYFTVTHSPIYDGEDSFTVIKCGKAQDSGLPGPDADEPWTLQMYLSTSDGITANGLPAVKAGNRPSLLIRVANTTSDDNPYYPVHLIGSPSNPIDITSTTVTYDADGAIDSTATAVQEVHRNVIVGETYPPIDSKTFRIGKWEIDEFQGTVPGLAGSTVDIDNQYAGINGGLTTGSWGEAAKAYWTLTGRAFDHFGDTPEGDTQDITPVVATAIEIHQERTFIAGFDADTPALRGLGEAQDLGLTIISSRSNQLTDFTSGPLDADSLQFIISSKAGGKISWLKSQFNQLFVGTTQEEYVVTSQPIATATLNIQLQSSYGSEYLKEAVIFGSDIVFIPTGKKTIRSMTFQERRQRYETDDLFQFARHLTKNETVERVELVSTEFQRLFVRTNLGNLYCFSKEAQNGVYGWSKWSNSNYDTIDDIVGTVDDSGNASLWARTSIPSGIYLTSDPDRDDYHVDGAVTHTGATITIEPGKVIVPVGWIGRTLSVIATLDGSGANVYLGDFTVVAGGGAGLIDYGNVISPDPTQVITGYPYTMTLAPNIPELMVPGKGSTLGRDKNISRLRILFNMARGATASGYELLQVPDPDGNTTVVADSPGFYSVPVVGAYGPQPTINITQSAPYGFEVSGYNAEYDFGD